MSMFADAYISTLGYLWSLGSAKCAKVFDVCLFFGEQRHQKGGHDRREDET